MNDVQQENECLESVLRALKAYRDTQCSETLIATLQDRVIDQRQRYDRLVHKRMSKVRDEAFSSAIFMTEAVHQELNGWMPQERELQAALESLKSFREESAGRVPDASSQRQLRVARNTLAKAQVKLGEAQSIEQMYRALLLQLRNDRDVARKDLADMDLACDKADRDMVQRQQQLKQRRSDHAAALHQHHSLVKGLQTAKQQAHLAILKVQDDVLHHHGHQAPCTLEAALADANACKERIFSIMQRVDAADADHAALKHQDSIAVDPGCGEGQPIRKVATTPEVLRKNDMEALCLSVRMDQQIPLCAGSSHKNEQALHDRHYQDTIRKGTGSTGKVEQEDGLCGAMADLTVLPTTDVTESQTVAPSSSSVASGGGMTLAPECSAVEADFISTRAISTSGTEESAPEAMPDGGQCSSELGEAAHKGDGNSAISEEDLVEAWHAVLQCMPGVRRLGHFCDGRQAGEVLKIAAVASAAQQEMMAVLQKWLANGEAELASRREGAMVIVAD